MFYGMDYLLKDKNNNSILTVLYVQLNYLNVYLFVEVFHCDFGYFRQTSEAEVTEVVVFDAVLEPLLQLQQ